MGDEARKLEGCRMLHYSLVTFSDGAVQFAAPMQIINKIFTEKRYQEQN